MDDIFIIIKKENNNKRIIIVTKNYNSDYNYKIFFFIKI